MNAKGFCGIDCQSCQVFLATKNNDLEAKKKLAEEWSLRLDQNYSPEQMECLGCNSKEVHEYCLSCDVRVCNLKKGTENCAHCSVFPCELIEEFWKDQPLEFERLSKENETLFLEETEDPLGEESYYDVNTKTGKKRGEGSFDDEKWNPQNNHAQRKPFKKRTTARKQPVQKAPETSSD